MPLIMTNYYLLIINVCSWYVLCDKEMNDRSIIKNLIIIWNVGGSHQQDFKYEKRGKPQSLKVIPDL